MPPEADWTNSASPVSQLPRENTKIKVAVFTFIWVRKKEKIVSEVGFEPTPTYVDQKAQNPHSGQDMLLSLAP